MPVSREPLQAEIKAQSGKFRWQTRFQGAAAVSLTTNLQKMDLLNTTHMLPQRI
jgi:hypothetical protein